MSEDKRPKLICRLCLESSSDLYDILIAANQHLIDKILVCTTIQIETKSRKFPTTICQNCINSVNKLYQFRENSINNQSFFVDQPNVMKSDVDEEMVPKPRILRSMNKVDNDKNESSNGKTKVKGSLRKLAPWEYSDSNSEMESNLSPISSSESDSDWSSNDDDDDEKELTKRGTVKRFGKTKIPKVKCKKCPKKVNEYELTEHMVEHSRHKCEVDTCGRRFMRANQLHRHIQNYHASTYQYTCKTCGKQYKIQRSYEVHLEVHLPPKYKCDICDRKFKRETHLNHHKRTHTGVKPYKCKLCSKSYTRTNNLREHMRSHKGENAERSYKCKLCAGAYNVKRSLKKHMQHFHPDAKWEEEDDY